MRTSTCIIFLFACTTVILLDGCSAAPTSAPTPLPTFTLNQPTAAPPTQAYTVYMPFTLPGKPGISLTPAPLPKVTLQISAQEVRVGETITVTGKVTGIGIPYYYLHLLDEGQQNAPPAVMITYGNELHPQEGKSQVLQLVSAKGGPDTATFLLRAIAPGVAGVSIQVTGEINTASGAQVMSGTGSEPVAVTVIP